MPTGQIGQLTLAETPLHLRLKVREGNAIKTAFEENMNAETLYRAALNKLAVSREQADLFLFDDFRLRAERSIDMSEKCNLPRPEQEVLELAKKYVIAARTFRDAVYFTIAKDRGHAGRAQAALLLNSLKPEKVKFKNTLRSYGFRQKFLSRSQNISLRRAIPDIDSNKVIAVNVLDKSVKVEFDHTPTMLIDEMKFKIGEAQDVSGSRIKLTLGNRILHGAFSLERWGIEPGTVLFYDVMPEEDLDDPLEEGNPESDDSDEGDDIAH